VVEPVEVAGVDHTQIGKVEGRYRQGSNAGCERVCNRRLYGRQRHEIREPADRRKEVRAREGGRIVEDDSQRSSSLLVAHSGLQI
jgi:hypothetical protein